MRTKTLEKIRSGKIITIVRGLYGECLIALAEALLRGGIDMMEITFDQKDVQAQCGTLNGISTLCERFDGRMLVGAGTVISREQVEAAHAAGAEYIVSPDTKPEVIRRTRELEMVSLPGALTPTEIALAHAEGADFVKVFPAAQFGPAYIKAIRGPLNHIPLLAVGGVNEKNARDFILAGCVGVGVGGNLVNKAWIQAGEYDRISALAREFVAAVRQED